MQPANLLKKQVFFSLGMRATVESQHLVILVYLASFPELLEITMADFIDFFTPEFA